MLDVDKVNKAFSGLATVNDVSFQIRASDIVGLIGPNGAGKSTLLNALMGVLPMRGSLPFDGEDVARLTLEERVMRGIALMPEKRELFGSMSVEDNLVLGGWRPRRQRVAGWRDHMDTLFTLFPRPKERRTQLAGTLSGGEHQMLAFGRALMGQPKLLMLEGVGHFPPAFPMS